VSAGDALIHARGLTKRFGALTAVDGIDFDVRKGEAFGFLGPNGAGAAGIWLARRRMAGLLLT
jgi:ABC-type branched-subunit amino acid transport system ATPase component